jgi:TPR repeat protein
MRRTGKWWVGLTAAMLLAMAPALYAAKNDAPGDAGEPPVQAAYRAGDYAKALRLARPLAEKEDPLGMYLLGTMYEHGEGVQRDDPTAVKWLAAASHKANYAPAEYSLARMYIDGRGVRKNKDKAREWLTAAAGQGHPQAKALLAELGGHSAGPAVASAPAAPTAAPSPAPAPAPASTPAPATAPAAASAAPAKPVTAPVAAATTAPPPLAKAPEPPAPKVPDAPKIALAAPAAKPAPEPPRPVEPAVKPAPAALPPATLDAARRNDPVFGPYSPGAAAAAASALQAAFKRAENLGPAAAAPIVGPPMLEAAMRYWEAEALGESKATEEMSRVILANGAAAAGTARLLKTSPYAADRATAALLTGFIQGGAGASADVCAGYTAAATTAPGAPDHAPAQYHAALCAAVGDAKQALAWLHAASNAGHAGALETLGRACIEGGDLNWGCAGHYFELAAKRGRASSMALYAWVLTNQPGADEKYFAEALAWYKKAAAAGDRYAQNNVGEMYERGRGTAKDAKAARQWYGRAAEAGFGPGQFNYARLLLAGDGGSVDRAGAVKWLQAADKNGIKQAKVALEQISAK